MVREKITIYKKMTPARCADLEANGCPLLRISSFFLLVLLATAVCVFRPCPLTKVDPFNVLKAVATGTVGGTVGDDHTIVVKSCTTCSSIPAFQDCLFSSQLSLMCIISFPVCMDPEIIMRKRNVSKHCHVWVSVGVKTK